MILGSWHRNKDWTSTRAKSHSLSQEHRLSITRNLKGCSDQKISQLRKGQGTENLDPQWLLGYVVLSCEHPQHVRKKNKNARTPPGQGWKLASCWLRCRRRTEAMRRGCGWNSYHEAPAGSQVEVFLWNPSVASQASSLKSLVTLHGLSCLRSSDDHS